MTELRKEITTETLLEKIPPETCWAITAENLTRLIISRILKTSTPFLGKDDGILSLLSGWEKEIEIKAKIYAEAGRRMYPFVKEMFNIPLENAVDAAKFQLVIVTLLTGPELKGEIVEATPERAVVRTTKCAWWERWFKDFEVNPGLIPCAFTHPPFVDEGLKAVNPKITCKLTKAMPRGDPYCEDVYEFKED